MLIVAIDKKLNFLERKCILAKKSYLVRNEKKGECDIEKVYLFRYRMVVFFAIGILFAVPFCCAEVVVNNVNIGTEAVPIAGNGVTGVDVDNDLTNNADVYVTGNAIYTQQGTVTNNGTAYSSAADAILTDDGDDTVTNSAGGTVTALDGEAIETGDGDDIVMNQGTLTATNTAGNGIYLGNGSDTLTNSGGNSGDTIPNY